HLGYLRFPSPVSHTREFFLSKEAPRLLVVDRVGATGRHSLVWRFHLDPAVTPTLHDRDVRLSTGSREVWLLTNAVTARFSVALEPGWVSPRYGVKVPTTVLVWRTSAAQPIVAFFLFAESL